MSFAANFFLFFAWAAAAAGPGGIGLEWVRIPGGEFVMGSTADPEARPAHRVVVASFEMAKAPVTNKQYQACVSAGACSPAPEAGVRCWKAGKEEGPPSRWRLGPLPDSFRGADQPAACVTWEQARDFSRWVGGALPSEAQWEYAARGVGKARAFPWGDAPASCRRAVMNNGCGRRATWPVCSKPEGNTAQGLCDMSGNVWQWVEDWYHPSYEGAPADGSAWENPAGRSHVARGGSWDDEIQKNLRADHRFSGDPGDDAVLIGFRPARRSAPDGLRFTADPRIDLIGLIQQLAGDNPVKPNPSLKRALERFEPWRGHPAVERMKILAGRGLRGNFPANFIVYLSTPPELAVARPIPGFLSGLAGGPEELEAFRREVSAFAKESSFMDWFAADAATAELPKRLAASADGEDLEGALARYLGGRSWDGWTVAASRFFPQGATSSWVIEEKTGLPDVFVVVGPQWSSEIPSFGTPWEVAAAVWPEAVFSTTYIVFELCRPKIAPEPGLCASTPGLVNQEDCLQQLWVRGIVRRLLEAEFGRSARRWYDRRNLRDERSARVDAVLAAYEKRADAAGLVEWGGNLLGPFQADRKAARCLLIDTSRSGEEVYSRRLRFYLEMRHPKS